MKTPKPGQVVAADLRETVLRALEAAGGEAWLDKQAEAFQEHIQDPEGLRALLRERRSTIH